MQYDVIGTARMQLLRPALAYRWPDGAAPYCTNGTASGNNQYSFPQPGWYQYNYGGVLAPQGQCVYLDANMSVPDALEANAIFLTSRETQSEQVLTPLPDCASGPVHTYCDWNTTSTVTRYTADVEMFTLLIDHVMASPYLGITRTVDQMGGGWP